MSRPLVLLLFLVAVLAAAGFKLESRQQSLVSFDSDVDADVDVAVDVDVGAGAESVTEVESENEHAVEVEAEAESESEVDADKPGTKKAAADGKKPTARAVDDGIKLAQPKSSPRENFAKSSYSNINEEFDHFLSKHKKAYSRVTNSVKYRARLKTYAANREIIRKHNALYKSGKKKWTMRITQHADKNQADMAAHQMNHQGVGRLYDKHSHHKKNNNAAAAAAPAAAAVKYTGKKARFAKKSAIAINQDGQTEAESEWVVKSGSATQGGATQGGATNGGATNGGATNGGATNGGATNGGATNGGATNGGATNGGATNGGATNGGATNGGAANGGFSVSGYTSRPADDVIIDWTKYDTFDWRKKCANCFGAVQDQGADGTCWVYSPVAVMEFQFAKKNGRFVKFSEPTLLNTLSSAAHNFTRSYDTISMNSTRQGLKHIAQNISTAFEKGKASYTPTTWLGRMAELFNSNVVGAYEGVKAGVKAGVTPAVHDVENVGRSVVHQKEVKAILKNNPNSGFATFPFQYVSDNAIIGTDGRMYHPVVNSNSMFHSVVDPARYANVIKVGVSDTNEFKSLLQSMGPAVINIDANQMHLYSNGIFESASAGADGSIPSGDHFVTAVGFGIKDGQEYIIFRNSWGANWGDAGYGRIRITDFDRQAVIFAKAL